VYYVNDSIVFIQVSPFIYRQRVELDAVRGLHNKDDLEQTASLRRPPRQQFVFPLLLDARNNGMIMLVLVIATR